MPRQRLSDLQIRLIKLLPDNIELHPQDPPDLFFEERIRLGLNLLYGYNPLGSKTINATTENCLQSATYGSGFHYLETVTGTTTNASITSPKLTNTDHGYHKFDLLVETNDCKIQFYNKNIDTFTDYVIVPKGFTSIEFFATYVVALDRVAGNNADVQIVGYW